MKFRKMSNSKKILILSVIVLGIGALSYALFSLLGANEKSKFYLVIGLCIAFVFYIGSSIIKLKRDGVLYDEREGHIEKESNAIAFNVFQGILIVLGLLTYKTGEIKINISGLIFLLFFIMWLVNCIVQLFVKRRS
ncbi:hypothetical protein [Candidatus Clostridium radicumherbarum]|uniref:DUF2178 domain-containing protein n=1 Tax=Candidatus Clostridium radicumherbarum TaxID=3381662 RepID=A0ABW8TX32_9CLOT